ASADGVLHLSLVVDHRWTGSAWLDTVPRISKGLDGDAGYVFVKLFDQSSAAAGLAMILLVGFANGIVFLFDHRRSAYGWVTVASFFGAFYPAFSIGLTQPVFGVYEPTVMGGAVMLSALSTLFFTASIFGRPHRRAWWGIFGLWCVLATWNAGPFRSTRFLTPVTVVTTVVVGIYCINLLVQEMRKGRPPLANVLATIGWPVVCVLAIDDFASWMGLGELYHGVRGASLGIAVLSMLQAAALGSQLLQSLRRSDGLNAELAKRVKDLETTNAEVGTLNEELRRQIGNRSQQLAETLANVGTLHMPALTLGPGDVVEGRYRVVRFVGSGGMAWVYEVQRVTDGRRLAMKLLHGRSSGDALSRFAREAKMASEVPHPNVVSVVDVDMTPDGVLFLVMEFVDGTSLEQHVDHDPPMAWSLLVMRQIASALEGMHARGIVHRDLKPANVLIEELLEGPVAKIADFGVSTLLARATHSSRPPGPADASGNVRVTRAGRVMGTP
ncbi:MAG TPA: serine/threonine-protein kinase, partial [Polyangiaceae bacterium]